MLIFLSCGHGTAPPTYYCGRRHAGFEAPRGPRVTDVTGESGRVGAADGARYHKLCFLRQGDQIHGLPLTPGTCVRDEGNMREGWSARMTALERPGAPPVRRCVRCPQCGATMIHEPLYRYGARHHYPEYFCWECGKFGKHTATPDPSDSEAIGV